jgi:hypothetical protein
MDQFSLESARAAARCDRTAIWVGEFLASRGSDNPELAAALAQERHWWAGPVSVEVTELVRLAGPEADALVKVAPQEWERDIEEMEASLERGWEPPPLLAEHRDGQLLLQDGNHRYESLVRTHSRRAWVLVFFDNPADRDVFLRTRASASFARAVDTREDVSHGSGDGCVDTA